mmetsp:Transcript_44831/g.125024  ORF Transcript_44831/g.125024 Transcript_44831/m.125024 type:complete len:234 (+) Transcript_44831:541-1242(+)
MGVERRRDSRAEEAPHLASEEAPNQGTGYALCAPGGLRRNLFGEGLADTGDTRGPPGVQRVLDYEADGDDTRHCQPGRAQTGIHGLERAAGLPAQGDRGGERQRSRQGGAGEDARVDEGRGRGERERRVQSVHVVPHREQHGVLHHGLPADRGVRAEGVQPWEGGPRGPRAWCRAGHVALFHGLSDGRFRRRAGRVHGQVSPRPSEPPPPDPGVGCYAQRHRHVLRLVPYLGD